MTSTSQKWISRVWSILLTLTIGMMLLGFSGCSSGDPEPADPKTKLYASWQVGTSGYLKRDGVIVTSNYSGFEVTFTSAGTYTSKNAGLVFKTSGTFSWTGDKADSFNRDGEIPTAVTLQEDGSLILSFQLDTNDVSGRQTATVGNWEIVLQPKK